MRAFVITTLAVLILIGVAGAAPFAYVASPGIGTGTIYVIDTATNNVTAKVNSGKYSIYHPVGVAIGSSVYSNMTDQRTMTTSNSTEDIGVIEETNLSSSEQENNGELNNSNNNDSESDNESKSSVISSTPGFGILGSLACLYVGCKLRKR